MKGLIQEEINSMFGKNILRKSFAAMTLAAVWTVSSMVAFALPKDVTGEITVTGSVTVNGSNAVSGATVFSDATITTASGSSAVVSLGKLGRVEVQADTTVKLTFSEGSIVATMDAGKVRISNASGVAATVATKNGTFVGDNSQANNFLVEAECSHSHVDATSGVVTLREATGSKQVVAGTSATSGNLAQTGCKPCLRPDSAPGPSVGNWPWLILLAAGAAGAGIYFGTRGDDNDFGGPGIVVSPVR